MYNFFGYWILRTNNAGTPLEWISYRDAVRLHYMEQVSYAIGMHLGRIYGGINAISNKQSFIDLHSIIATHGTNPHLYNIYTPPLNNTALFRRDGYICMYCGQSYKRNKLSRDHILPLSQGGHDDWKNVVTACRTCNNKKAGKTPEEAKMELIAIPFVPTRAEYVYLQSRNILADQMEFLKNHFPRNSRLHKRLN